MSEEIGKTVSKVRIVLRIFSHIIALTLGLNSVKVLRVTKNVKEIKFQGVWTS